MKRNKEIEALSDSLKALNEKIALPDSLGAQAVAELVSGSKQKKKGKIIALKALGTVAAVFALCLGAAVIYGQLTKPAINTLPSELTVAPTTDTTEQNIIDYFTVLKAKYKDQHSVTDFIYIYDDVSSFNRNDSMEIADTAESANGNYSPNNQVSGVDEIDILKNDGKYLYTVSDGGETRTLSIIEAKSLTLVSQTKLDALDELNLHGMYVYGNYVMLLTSDDGFSSEDRRERSKVTVFDTTDKTKPKRIKSFVQDGWLTSSRLTGGKLIFITSYSVNIGDVKLSDGYVKYSDVVPQVYNGNNGEAISCDCITVLPNQNSSSYLVMSVIDLNNLDQGKISTSAILSNGNVDYSTAENYYIACEAFKEATDQAADSITPTYSQTTTLYRFSFARNALELTGTAEIEGYLLDQFAIDEKDGYLRLAAHLDEENRIYVLDKELKQIAKITGIAKGEDIRSVRYIGDYGYVVTYLQTDPLFCIDFTDITAPKIAGELKITGFSNYLHPYKGYLIGIGPEGDDDGLTSGFKVCLFDISNPEKPTLLDKITMAGYFSGNHKEFFACESQDVFGFVYNNKGEVYQRVFSSFTVENGKLKIIGTYTNFSSTDSSVKDGYYYDADGNRHAYSYSAAMVYDSDLQIDRATYIGSTLYTVSNSRICAYPLSGGACIRKLDF